MTTKSELRVDVWYAAPPALDAEDLARCNAELTPEERDSVQRFVTTANRRERLVARALVRSVLARHREVDPRSLRFGTGPWGKPQIDPPTNLRFNLAHHPTLVVLVAVEGAEVGIDVEPIARHPQIADVSERVFAPRELADLAALGESARADRLVSLWTLKEAYIKARGMGLSLPLRKLAFVFDGASPRLSADGPVDSNPERWAFAISDVEGHRIAVAVDAPDAVLGIQVRGWIAPSPG